MQNRGVLKYQSVGFKIFGRNKQLGKKLAVDALMPIFSALLVILYIFTFVGRVLGYFLFAAVYLLFAMLIASIMRKLLETGVLFRTAVYAKVLMFVAAMILGLIPFMNVFVLFLLRVVVTIGFMAFAIAKLPENKPMPMGPGMGMGPGPGQGWQ